MKIRSPFRSPQHSPGSSSNNPRMRDFGDDKKAQQRRFSRSTGLHSSEHGSNVTWPSDQYSSIISTAETIMSASQYKVSEIVNPDGTVTVRNLVITKDGKWECEEEERDYCQEPNERPASASSNTKSYTTMHSTRSTPTSHTRTQIQDKIPELEPVASFGSSGGSTSSSEAMKTAKSRSDVSEVSEAAGHELRRQRLAKARNMHQTYSIPESPISPGSQSSFESSRVITLMQSPIGSRSGPTTPVSPLQVSNINNTSTQIKRLEKSSQRPKRPTALITRHARKEDPGYRSKHVAFVEARDVDTTSSLMTSSNDETDGADSLGYPGVYGQQEDDDHDDESSVFRDVLTPSPEGTTNIEDILGPAPLNMVPSTPRSGNGSANGRRSPNKSPIADSPSTRMSREVASVEEEGIAPYEILQDEEGENEEPPLHTVTVHKVSRHDKIGIFVGIKKYSFGTRLVVSRVSPDGKFAGTGVDVGDIVVSINGKSMMENPSSQEAFEIVKSAEDQVTFVVQKRRDADDHQSVAGTTISSVSRDWALPYTPDRSGQSTVEGGESKDESTKRRMVEDGSLVIIKESTITEPIPVKANESWKLSGAIVVVVKMKSSSHNPGLRLGTKETSTGRVLHIADINPSSPFTNTPLRVGDVVISINNVDLQDNADVVDAYSALGKSKDEIAVVARKSEESLTEFLEDRKARVKPYAGVKSRERVFEATPVVEPSNSHQISPAERPIGSTLKKIEVTSLPDEMPAPSLCDTSFEFDEESYGASLNGYNSSKLIHIAKSYPQESLGLDLSLVSTEWGALLTIVRISPYCKAASTGIRVGDAILAINGVDFRENANVEQAQSVIKQARKDVDIEIQQLSLRPTTIPEKQTNFNDGITILESNNVGVVRTRTFDSNDDFLTQSETLKIAGKVDKEDPYNSSASMRSLDIPMVRRTQSSTPKEDDRSSLALQRTKKFRKVWITVVKEHAREIVGISFTTIQNKLIVTDVSPSGLLRGAPVLPGDTILSINGVNFSRDPNAEYAFALVVRAPKELLFEVLKTGYVIGVDKVEPKSCLRRLACNRSRKDQGVMYLEKEDDDGETLSMSMIE